MRINIVERKPPQLKDRCREVFQVYQTLVSSGPDSRVTEHHMIVK